MGQVASRAGEYVPKSCTWELTLRCNLDCGHCGSRAGRPRRGEMDRTLAFRVMGELAALGCEKVSLSGGEPTLSPYWRDLVEEGSRLGVRLNMITNGLSADRELVRSAREAGLRGLGVSLDGFEEAHDRLRGRAGMFRRVMDLLDDCAAEGLRAGVITTIWSGNKDDLEAMAELLEGRVYVWQVQLGESMGNLRDRDLGQVAPRDLLEILPTLARIARAGRVPLRVSDNIGYFGPHETCVRSKPDGQPQLWAGCMAGCRHLGIEADGGVKGCLSLQSVTTTEGNLRESALAEIWHREGAFAYNRAFSLDDLSGFCRTCAYAARCRGGCTSARTCEGGVDNPFCYHRVATVARDAERARLRKAIARAVAPAALAALVGLGAGCDGPVDYYGLPDYDADQSTDGDADQDAVDFYGLPDADADADADQDAVDFYGLPDADADADQDAVDFYGLPDDAGLDAAADADLPVDYYGMPEDAGLDADARDADLPVSWYGMPDDGE